MLNKNKMAKFINPNTGVAWIDERISRKARRLGLMRYEGDGEYGFFDRVGYIEACLEIGKPIVITWVPNIIRLRCRDYQDVFGVPDLMGIEEIPTLFTNKKDMKQFRIFLIPYLITGMDIPPELEQDEEPLVPFTAKDIEMIKEIEKENGNQ